MMRPAKFSKLAAPLFALFGVLALLDLVLCLVAADYRNQLGRIGTAGPLLARVVPDVVLIAFYSIYLIRFARREEGGGSLVLAHSLVLGALGLLLLIPWLGPFVAPLTPIAVLYVSALALSGQGYLVAMAVAALFVIANGILLVRDHQV